MVAQLINAAVLSTAESVVNRYIALDPAAVNKLSALAGKVLRVHCNLPSLTINMLVAQDRLVFSHGETLDANTTVSGSLTALLSLLHDPEPSRLREKGIVITGNTALLTALQDLLANLNVDWEYQLSKFIGDIPTQLVSEGATTARKFGKRASSSLTRDFDVYLHEEKNLFPEASQLQSFYKDIDAFRLRVDRLESRTTRLQHHLSRQAK